MDIAFNLSDLLKCVLHPIVFAFRIQGAYIVPGTLAGFKASSYQSLSIWKNLLAHINLSASI